MVLDGDLSITEECEQVQYNDEEFIVQFSGKPADSDPVTFNSSSSSEN
jgi:hypothetical protein